MIFERGFFHTYYVIQTTEGRKNRDDIKDVPEILRYALDDIKI